MDFSVSKYTTAENLQSAINNQLAMWEEIYGASSTEDTFSLRLEGVIRRAHEQTSKQVVLLVDEYDPLMLDSNEDAALQKELRNMMRDFFTKRPVIPSLCFFKAVISP